MVAAKPGFPSKNLSSNQTWNPGFKRVQNANRDQGGVNGKQILNFKFQTFLGGGYKAIPNFF